MMNRFLIALFTVSIILTVNCSTKINVPIQLAILPFEDFHPSYVQFIKQEIEKTYHAEVTILSSHPLPPSTFYQPRQRYRADKLIAWLLENIPQNQDYILGLTSKDISTTKGEYEDWGIMGLAYCPGKSAVVSTFRTFRNAHSKKHRRERLTKVVIHELGHNFGIPHCKYSKKCNMQDACGTIKSIDLSEEYFCKKCSVSIEYLLRK